MKVATAAIWRSVSVDANSDMSPFADPRRICLTTASAFASLLSAASVGPTPPSAWHSEQLVP
jgi:hypothetical protein